MITSKSHHFLQRCYSSQVPMAMPVIKIPKYVEKHVEKVKKKEFLKMLTSAQKRRILYRGNTSIPVISSTLGDYNHYLGQLYNEKYPVPLQSKTWHKTKSYGEKFTIRPFEKNPALALPDPDEYVDDNYFPNEFSKMNLNDNINNNLLNYFKFQKPTRIQTLVIPRILSGQNILVASETGSGKTVAYLAPILHQLMSLKKNVKPVLDSPLALILTPGRELAEQIGSVAYNLAKDCDINVKVLISDGTRMSHLKVLPNYKTDLMVASIGCFQKLVQKRRLFLSNVRQLILDEADTLLDDSFIPTTKYLLQKMTIRTSDPLTQFGAQVVFTSSVYPTNLHSILSDEFTEKDIVKVCSQYLHRVPAHIQQKFCRINSANLSGEILALVKNDYEKKKPVIIFCNKSPTCDWLSSFLIENGVLNAVLHGAIDPRERLKAIRQFQNGTKNVLCCTDLGSRGLDTQRAMHVINFDFPNNASDYLLRVGRVGRVGSNQGHVTNLVVSKSGIYTVRDIEQAVKTSERISKVDSNITLKIKKLYFTH